MGHLCLPRERRIRGYLYPLGLVLVRGARRGVMPGHTITSWSVCTLRGHDNKLMSQVSSTVSHLPPIPPLSPTPTGNSSTVSSQIFPHTRSYDLNRLHPNASTRKPPSLPSVPSNHTGQTGGAVIVLPDGTVLSSAGTGSTGEGRTVAETMAHSSAGSPWNVLVLHVLPLFGGGEIKSSIEDLK